MMLGFAGSHSAEAITALAMGRRAIEKDQLDALLEEAARWKPAGYDRHQIRIRHQYEGRGAPYVVAALAKRYPKTFTKMPVVSLNVARLCADVDASVYDEEPTRWVEDELGNRLGDGGRRARAFYDLERRGGFNALLVEAERRTMLALTTAIRLHVKNGVTCGRLFWCHAIHVIPDPSAPTDATRLHALIAEVQGPAKGSTRAPARWFEVWTRATLKAPWVVQVVSTDGDNLQTAQRPLEWPGPLPWVFMRRGLAEGTIFVDGDRDLPDMIDEVNIALSDAIHLQNMQGHSPLVLKSDGTTKRAHIVGGPAAVIEIGTNEQLQALALSPHLADARKQVDQLLRYIAITRQQPEDALSVEKDYLSGESRFLKMEAARKRRRMDAKASERFEEDELWPAVIGMEQADGRFALAGVRVRMQPRETPDYADPVNQATRAQMLLSMGLISPARAGVIAGEYRDEAAAMAHGLSGEIAGAGSSDQNGKDAFPGGGGSAGAQEPARADEGEAAEGDGGGRAPADA